MGRPKPRRKDDVGQRVLTDVSDAYAELEQCLAHILKHFKRLPPAEVAAFRSQLRSAREISQAPALFLLRDGPPDAGDGQGG